MDATVERLVNAEQTATGGSFAVGFRGQTATINNGDNQAAVEAALDALADVTVVFTSGSGVGACSAGNQMFITYEVLRGDVELPTVDASAPTGTSPEAGAYGVADGIAPVWGNFRLQYGGLTSHEVSVDADAATVEAALESLATIGDMTVEASPIGVDQFGRAGLTRRWTVTFDSQTAHPLNRGPLALLIEDDSALQSTSSTDGQPVPRIVVDRVQPGVLGNTKEDGDDASSIEVVLTHQTADHRVAAAEVQRVVCRASSGTVALRVGARTAGATLTVNAGDAPAAVAALFKSTFGLSGDVSVRAAEAATFCSAAATSGVERQFAAADGDVTAVTADISQLDAGSSVAVTLVKGGVTVTYEGGSTGAYTIEYTPEVKGAYNLSVTLGAQPVGVDTSAGVFIEPAAASGPHSVHDAASDAREGVEEAFVVQLKDRFRNELDGGLRAGEQLSATLAGTAGGRAGQTGSGASTRC